MGLRVLYTACVGTAAGLTVLAVFTKWASLDVPLLGEASQRGWEGDGMITLLLGLLAFGFAVYTWAERRLSTFRLTASFTGFLGVVIFAIALVNLLDTERSAGAIQDKLGVDLDRLIGLDVQSFVDTGAGVYSAIAAGLLLAVASWLAFAAARLRPAAIALTSQDPADCPRCGAERPAGARFCPECGAAVG